MQEPTLEYCTFVHKQNLMQCEKRQTYIPVKQNKQKHISF